jgi:hypothetical protein
MEDTSVDIMIEVDNEDKEYFESIFNAHRITVDMVETQRFGGMTETLAFIAAITTASLPVISKVIVEAIRAKHNVKIKIKGLEIDGITEENAMKILAEYFQKESSKKNKHN